MKKKIPFDISYKDQIESGYVEVVTKNDNKVRILCFDRNDEYCKIVALVTTRDNKDNKIEYVFNYDINGKDADGDLHNNEYDLFLLVDNGLTIFEKCLADTYESFDLMNKNYTRKELEDFAKSDSEKLLDAAREQLQKEFYTQYQSTFDNIYEDAYNKGLIKGAKDTIKKIPTFSRYDVELIDRIKHDPKYGESVAHIRNTMVRLLNSDGS